MNRNGKILAVCGVLLSLFIASIILVISISPTSAQTWQDYLTLEYNTDNCLGICEAIFTVKNPGTTAIPMASNDVRIWHVVGKGPGLTKEIEVYREETISYQEEVPDYGNCSFVDGNGTTVTYTCQTGTHNETKMRKEFLPFTFDEKSLATGETWRIKLVGYKKPSLGENNVEWLLDFRGLQPPWAWWLSNYTYVRNNTVNSTITSNIKNVPVAINHSGGFLDSTNGREHVWCLLDDLPPAGFNTSIIFYYNKTDFDTDYKCFNASDNKELPKEVEMGNGTNINGRAVWRESNYDAVFHANGTCADSSGQFAPTCTGFSYNNTGLIGKALDLDSITDRATFGDVAERNATISLWIYLYAAPSGVNEYFFENPNAGSAYAKITTARKVHTDTVENCPSLGGNSMDSDTPLELNTWHHVAITSEDGAGTSDTIRIYINGTLDKSGPGCFGGGTGNFTIGRPAHSMTSAKLDEIRWRNVTMSANEIKAEYELIARNYSLLGPQQVTSSNATETQGDAAIQEGIANSVINGSNHTNYTSWQIYRRDDADSHKLGRFDVVAVSGNQTWAFNFVTSGDPTSGFTSMTNMTPVLYVWEAANKSSAQIKDEVKGFIDGSKQSV